MGDGSLSQDEIDALLQGADDMLTPGGPAAPADTGAGASSISVPEQNTLRNTLGSIMGSVAPSLSGYLGGRNITIANPVVEVKPQAAIRSGFTGKYVQVSMDYQGAVNGRNLIVFNFKDAGSISSLMMGDEKGAAPADLSDAHQSTVQEFTNQLLASAATQLSHSAGGAVNTTPAMLSIANNAAAIQLPAGNELVKITYDFVINGVVNSKLYHIMDTGLAGGLGGGGRMAQSAMGAQMVAQQPQVGISPVKFPPLDEGIPAGVGGNISLILDVPMTLTVELGRTTQLVQDILGLGEGSIIELDKLAGEPVDLLVNGKLIAKGEVVVIDENFGVRVTDIVSPSERLTNIKQQ